MKGRAVLTAPLMRREFPLAASLPAMVLEVVLAVSGVTSGAGFSGQLSGVANGHVAYRAIR